MCERQAAHDRCPPFAQSRPQPIPRLERGGRTDDRTLQTRGGPHEPHAPGTLQLQHALVDTAHSQHVFEQGAQIARAEARGISDQSAVLGEDLERGSHGLGQLTEREAPAPPGGS